MSTLGFNEIRSTACMGLGTHFLCTGCPCGCHDQAGSASVQRSRCLHDDGPHCPPGTPDCDCPEQSTRPGVERAQ